MHLEPFIQKGLLKQQLDRFARKEKREEVTLRS